MTDDMYGKYCPAEPATLQLESNFGPMDPEAIGYLQPTTMDTPLEEMHRRFAHDGYLFVSVPLKPCTRPSTKVARPTNENSTSRSRSAFPRKHPSNAAEPTSSTCAQAAS